MIYILNNFNVKIYLPLVLDGKNKRFDTPRIKKNKIKTLKITFELNGKNCTRNKLYNKQLYNKQTVQEQIVQEQTVQ